MTVKLEAPHSALLEERTRLQTQYEALDDELRGLGDVGADNDVTFDEEGGEGSPVAVERDRIRSLMASSRAAMDEVDAALARMEAGTYGVCESCGGAIAPERLEALPTTTVCVSCKAAGPLGRRRR